MFLSQTQSLLMALSDPCGVASPERDKLESGFQAAAGISVSPSFSGRRQTQSPCALGLRPPASKRLGRLLELADWHGVLPAVVQNMKQLIAAASDGWHSFQPEPAAWERAGRQLRLRAVLSLVLRQQARQALVCLEAAGVPAVVLKGSDFADRLYPQPALRPFTDVDLLIPRHALEPARTALRGLGYQPVPARMKHETGYGEESWRRQNGPTGTVELHWDLVNSPALRRAVSVTYQDLQLEMHQGRPRPSAAALLLIAAVHGVTGHSLDRLQGLRDVVQAVRGAAGPMDAPWLAQTVRRTGAERAMAFALAVAGRLCREPRCRELKKRLGISRPVWPARLLLSRGVVLRAHARCDSFRRQLLREFLK
jgi:hypothetical protein